MGGSEWLEFIKVFAKLYIPRLHNYFEKKRIEAEEKEEKKRIEEERKKAVENTEVADGEMEEEFGIEEMAEDEDNKVAFSDEEIASALKDEETRKEIEEWLRHKQMMKKLQ